MEEAQGIEPVHYFSPLLLYWGTPGTGGVVVVVPASVEGRADAASADSGPLFPGQDVDEDAWFLRVLLLLQTDEDEKGARWATVAVAAVDKRGRKEEGRYE